MATDTDVIREAKHDERTLVRLRLIDQALADVA